MGTDSPSEEGATHRLLVPKGSVAAKLAEIYTVPLHSSYTAKKLHAICNENSVMQKIYHPLRMTAFMLMLVVVAGDGSLG